MVARCCLLLVCVVMPWRDVLLFCSVMLVCYGVVLLLAVRVVR